MVGPLYQHAPYRHPLYVASNEDMAITLKDERLQQRILEIDNAPNREQVSSKHFATAVCFAAV